MNIKTYNPKQVLVSFAGSQVQGFANGTFIKISYNSPVIKKEKGIDGKTAISKVLDFDATVELSLLQNSEIDKQLRFTYTQALQDSETKSNLPSYPLTISDYSSGLIWTTDETMIQNVSEVVLADNQQARVWQLCCINMKCKYEPTSNVNQILSTILKTSSGFVDNTARVINNVRTFFG